MTDATTMPIGTDGWDSLGHSDTGLCRQINEDALLARPEAGLWLVADGVGGGCAGDRASQALVELGQQLHICADLLDQTMELEEAVLELNRQMCLYAAEQWAGRVMATTLVALLLRPGRGVCLWAGDSRLYRWHGGALQRISHDHSMYQSCLDAGQTPAEIPAQLKNRILRAVGAKERLTLDAQAFISDVEDRYLLCSDGVHTLIADAELQSIMAQSPDQAVAQLKELCLQRGAPDNFTYLLVTPAGLACNGLADRSDAGSTELLRP